MFTAHQTPDECSWFQGSADAVMRAMDTFCLSDDSLTSAKSMRDVLIMPAELVYQADYNEIIKVHRNSDADVTIMTSCVDESEANQHGVIGVHPGGKVYAFETKACRYESHHHHYKDSKKDCANVGIGLCKDPRIQVLAPMGVYIFKAKVLDTVLRKAKDLKLDFCDVSGECYSFDFGDDVIPLMLQMDLRVQAFHHAGRVWRNMNSIISYHEANLSVLSEHKIDNPFREFHEKKCVLHGEPRIVPPSRFVGNCIVSNSFIGEGGDFYDSIISRSVIGNLTSVSSGSHIRNSFLAGGSGLKSENWQMKTHIGRNCVINDAILGKNVHIGDNVNLCNFSNLQEANDINGVEGLYIREGKIAIKAGTVLPSDVTV